MSKLPIKMDKQSEYQLIKEIFLKHVITSDSVTAVEFAANVVLVINRVKTSYLYVEHKYPINQSLVDELNIIFNNISAVIFEGEHLLVTCKDQQWVQHLLEYRKQCKSINLRQQIFGVAMGFDSYLNPANIKKSRLKDKISIVK